jgi:hypothetical protein
LTISPQACLEFAARHTWEASARAFVENITNVPAFDPTGDFDPTGEAVQFEVKRPGFVA